MLSDFGASWSYANVDGSLHAAIERVEVRALGILLEVRNILWRLAVSAKWAPRLLIWLRSPLLGPTTRSSRTALRTPTRPRVSAVPLRNASCLTLQGAPRSKTWWTCGRDPALGGGELQLQTAAPALSGAGGETRVACS